MIDFRTEPGRYRHWKVNFDGAVAELVLEVDENGGLFPGYELKLNSYDLGVDIELDDAVQRLRFEHPEVRSVIVRSGRERVFCAGANIRMLAQSNHGLKVNFCKFTNETRNAIEDATINSGQRYLAAIIGACAGGGYELALATDYLIMADDGATAVSLPEVPLLAVLPGTGGLTRLVDKRGVRRDRADFFCTTEEGIKGRRAVEWKLVDEVVPRTQLLETARKRALESAACATATGKAGGIMLTPLERTIEDARVLYSHVEIDLDRNLAAATLTVHGPDVPPPDDAAGARTLGDRFWPLAIARELDDAILHLRFNEDSIRTWIFRTDGDLRATAAYDRFLVQNSSDWLIREVTLFLKRTLKRLDVSSRSIFTLIEPGSCFAGTLLEIALAADRIYILSGQHEGEELPAAKISLTEMNFGPLPMCNGLTRLESRFLNDRQQIKTLRAELGNEIDATHAEQLGLATFTPDDIDWDDEVRLAIEGRAAFSSDALTGMEASLRFAGPETVESKIFARLSAWQNWIFQRPNAVGDNGALKRYGSGQRAEFDPRRV
jgi:benzoyl-CoA-dihydrodiol lyase